MVLRVVILKDERYDVTDAISCRQRNACNACRRMTQPDHITINVTQTWRMNTGWPQKWDRFRWLLTSVKRSVRSVCFDSDRKTNKKWTLACDDIMPTGWTPAAASSTLEEWTRTFSWQQQCSYSTEFGQDSRKFASGIRKYGKFSHFLTHPVVYGGQGKNKYYLL